jgi:signal transduction histidine kinase
MSFLFRRRTVLAQPEQISVVVVVAIGYAVTLVGSLFGASLDYTPLQAVVAVVLGLMYVSLLLFNDAYFGRYPAPSAKLIYFSAVSLLVVAVPFLLIGPGMWLIPLPILGIAVERITPRWRWPVYTVVVAGLPLALGIRTGDWVNAFNSLLLLLPALLFVVVITQLRLSERRARQEAEQMSRQLEATHDQLAAYVVQAEELATTKERNRLAREIHDNLGHYLTVVHVQLEAARAVMSENPERALDALNKAQKLTQEGLSTVRRSVASLRESPVDNRPLVEAIGTLLGETRSAGIVAELDVQGTRRTLELKTNLTLYRIVQEALTNVRKHARASRVDVNLDYQDHGSVRLVVKDNGVGTAGIGNDGFGLVGMRERVQLLGGELRIETGPGQGFSLEAVVPG